MREGSPPARPWLTVVLDDYSRAVAGYFLTFEPPCAMNTALALRQAVWRKDDPRWHVCGVPDVFYTDNGSDFTSRHMEQVGADLKMRLVFSTPGVPRGRGRIERFFGTVAQMLLCTLPGYCPPNPHAHALAGGTAPSLCAADTPLLNLAALDARFREFLLGDYHRREHGQTKAPPQERWEAGGFLPRMPDTLERLDLLLLTVAHSRRVRPDGLRFQGLRYTDPTLAAYVGEDVTLRYAPRDLAEVRVFHRERFLCRAVCQEVAGQTVPLREIIQARNRRRRELRQVLTDRSRLVETLLGVHQSPTGPGDPLPGDRGSPEEKGEQSAGPPAEIPAVRRYWND
ncbi:MAG: transposase family protein [Armatimonadota bacterium]|nr:transposase family protein [Armatimonadota bacterium]